MPSLKTSIPLAYATHAIKQTDKTKTKKEIHGNIQGRSTMRVEVSNRSHMFGHRCILFQHHLLHNCCSPSCGLLCVGSPGGPTKATAAAQRLYRHQTGLVTGNTVSFT